jgi:hypothetical protein
MFYPPLQVILVGKVQEIHAYKGRADLREHCNSFKNLRLDEYEIFSSTQREIEGYTVNMN